MITKLLKEHTLHNYTQYKLLIMIVLPDSFSPLLLKIQGLPKNRLRSITNGSSVVSTSE